MTGKRNDISTLPSEAEQPPAPLSKAARERLAAELAHHEASAAAIESRTGQRDTYHHTRAAELRAALNEENDNGKLD